MKKAVVLSLVLVASGLQAMEVETGQKKEESELVQLQEEGGDLYIVVEDNKEATYLFLVTRYGKNAHAHIPREFKGSSEEHLKKAKDQLSVLKQVLNDSDEYHWDSFFSVRRDELEPGSLIYKINTPITREALDKVLEDSVLTQGMRTLTLSSQEDFLSLAAKASRTRIRKSWEKGYVLGVKLGGLVALLATISTALITYSFTTLTQNCE